MSQKKLALNCFVWRCTIHLFCLSLPKRWYVRVCISTPSEDFRTMYWTKLQRKAICFARIMHVHTYTGCISVLSEAQFALLNRKMWFLVPLVWADIHYRHHQSWSQISHGFYEPITKNLSVIARALQYINMWNVTERDIRHLVEFKEYVK